MATEKQLIAICIVVAVAAAGYYVITTPVQHTATVGRWDSGWKIDWFNGTHFRITRLQENSDPIAITLAYEEGMRITFAAYQMTADGPWTLVEDLYHMTFINETTLVYDEYRFGRFWSSGR